MMMARTDTCSGLLIGICLMVLFVPQNVFLLSQGFEPTVCITFDNNTVNRPGVSFISNDDVVNITTSTEVAGAVDGFVGFFDGESYLQLELPEVDPRGSGLSRFSAEIRFLDTDVNNVRYSVLMGSLNIFVGLIHIGLSGDYKLRVFLNTMEERVILEMLYKKPGWKVLRLDYNPARQNPSLRLKLKDSTGRVQTLSKHVTGNIEAASIVVGAAEFFANNFIGFMDHVKIWV